MKRIKKKIAKAILYTFSWRNVDKHVNLWAYDGNYFELRKEMRGMKEELERLGIELAKLAKKYKEEYLTLAYVNESIQGSNDPEKQEERISIYLSEAEVEKRCLTE